MCTNMLNLIGKRQYRCGSQRETQRQHHPKWSRALSNSLTPLLAYIPNLLRDSQTNHVLDESDPRIGSYVRKNRSVLVFLHQDSVRTHYKLKSTSSRPSSLPLEAVGES